MINSLSGMSTYDKQIGHFLLTCLSYRRYRIIKRKISYSTNAQLFLYILYHFIRIFPKLPGKCVSFFNQHTCHIIVHDNPEACRSANDTTIDHMYKRKVEYFFKLINKLV